MKKLLFLFSLSIFSVQAVNVMVIDADGHLHQNIEIPVDNNLVRYELDNATHAIPEL